MSQTDEEETSEIESFILDQESFSSDHSALASKLALLAATGHAAAGDGTGDDQISVDAETQARLEALLEAAGIGKLSTSDGKAFADPEVLRRLSSSVSCALDEAAAALSKMKAESENPNEQTQERTLVEACSEGDVKTVRKLLYEGRSPNEVTEDGESLLSLACSAGYYELAEVLLSVPPYSDESTYLTNESSHNLRRKINSHFLATLNQQLTQVLVTMHANVEECGSKGECTPLMEAASGGYTDIIRLLLAHGANVNAASSTGNTALTYACCGGYEDVVRLLLDEGAEIECHNENGHTPLMEAASGGHVGVAALLLERGAGINTHSNEFKESALTLACYKGHLQMVQFLLQAGADQEHKTDEMHTALMEASMDGHVEVAKLLLDSGAQVNMPADSFESPLTLAACGGHVDLADLLIRRGAALEEINDEGYTPLMEAAREGHDELAALLINKGAKINAKTEETQETALTLAACGGYLECVELLVSAGADIEAGCSTPLMEAAQEGQMEVVKFLLQIGANVNAVTASGDTALSYACEHGHTDVADHLLACGADLEHESDGGRTPLMKASRAGHPCTVQFLLSRGADVNKTSKNNEHTALSLACVCGHLPVVELLLCQGADLTHKLKDGSTMLLEAAKGGHTPVVQLLLDFPHSYMAFSAEPTQVNSPTNEQLAPRVPIQSLPMVVPPQEPDQAPELGIATNCESYQPDGAELNSEYDVKLPLDNDKATSQAHSIYQQQLHYYQQQNPASTTSEPPFNTAALVTHLIHQGGLLSQASEHLTPDTKLAVDKDVATTVESFLRSMANDAAAGKARTAESIVEEAQGKLTELEQRIKEAIEKNAQLKSIEMMQTDQLTKEKVEELYKTREEQIHKKQKILEELQKVERELQLKTQQQLKKHYMELTQEEVAGSSQRGKPDGEATEQKLSHSQEIDDVPKLEPAFRNNDASNAVLQSKKVPSSMESHLPVASQRINNGSSGSLSQAPKNMEDPFCQCNHHPCPQLSHSPADDSCVDMQQPLPPVPGFSPTSSVMSYPHLDIDGHTESNHDTPLTLACAGGHDDLVQLLISRGANIEHRDKKGFTPLILAATAGHVGVVNTLLESNADIEAQSERTKDTPLSLACSGGRMEVVELLLFRCANKEHRNVSDYTPLSLAASGGYVNIIKHLLSNGAEINSRTGSKLGISPLMLAAMNGHTQAVQLLLDMGADINAQIETNRNTALTLACFQGRHEVVSLLVDRKANVEHRAKTGLTPLMEAASGGYAEVGKVLLDKGADPNAAPVPSSRDTALTIAADKGHFRFCELVLSRGAQVEVRNKKGNTPLWLACNGGHLDVAKLLVEEGADVNAADNRNVTPLMAAFRKGNLQVVRWMVLEVSQFPSDTECARYIATINDADLTARLNQCMESIRQAKERQAQEANKYASELLEELDMEKTQEEDRKERAARKREKRRLKRKQKSTKKVSDDARESNENNDHEEVKEQNNVKNTDEITESVDKLQIDDVTSTSNTMSIVAATVVATTTITTSALESSDDKKVAQSVPTSSTETHHSRKPTSPLTHVTERDETTSKYSASYPKEKPKSPEMKRRTSPQQNIESFSATVPSSAEMSPRQSMLRKTRKPPNYYKKTTNAGEPAPTRSTPRSSSSTHGSFRSVNITPGKRTSRRDEGWKEVTRKFTNPSSGKRILISSSLISRVIGRGGCNINAIRELTGAHIDIDKQKKGGVDRTVTIKGSAEAVKYAQQLITDLVKEDKTDHEVADIIMKAQAQASQMQAVTKPSVQKPTMTVVAAPIPSKPAWTVPPSIVAQSSRRSRQPVTTSTTTTTSTVKVGVWKPPATTTSTTTTSTPSAPNKWNLPTSTVSTSAPTVETVKKALFVAPQLTAIATSSVPSVTFSSKTSDKPSSKPVQPVAPMVSTKVTTSRMQHLSFGPVGSGLPTSQQVHGMLPPIQDQRPSDPGHVTPRQRNAPSIPNPISPNENSRQVENMVSSIHNMMPQSRGMGSGQSVEPQSVQLPHPVTPGQNGPRQNQNYLTPVQSSVATSVRSDPSPGQPHLTPGSNVRATPVRGIQPIFSSANSETPGAMNSNYNQLRPEGTSVASPTYSPFSNSFTPSAGSGVLWNDTASVPPYKPQSNMNTATPIDAEPQLNSVDQSKAPGYRGNMKSPAVENGIIGGSTVQGAVSNPSSIDNPSPSGSQQGSPGNDPEVSSKPRPIGTERAYHRRVHPSQPLTTVVGPQAPNIWAFQGNTLQASKYGNWSGIPAGRSDGIITTATSNKPQVTISEHLSAPKTPNVDLPPNHPQMQIMNRPYYPGQLPVGYNAQNRMQPNANRFSQPSNAGRVGTQPPIGSHLGGGSSVGVIGPHQHQTPLQPIGSHLGGAGHVRSNAAYQQGQMQRNFAANPVQQGHRFHMPYYMQQPDMSRYAQTVSSDMNWQQHQHSMYNGQSRHPALSHFPHKEMPGNNPMYGNVPSHFSNMQSNDVGAPNMVQGYGQNMSDMTTPQYQVHPDAQGGYMNNGGQYFDGGNEYVVRNVVPNNYNPTADSSSNWEHNLCRSTTGYHSMNGGPDAPQVVGSPQGIDGDAPQGWKKW